MNDTVSRNEVELNALFKLEEGCRVYARSPISATHLDGYFWNTRSYRGQSSGEEFSPTRDSTRNSVKLRRNNFSSHPRPSSSARLILNSTRVRNSLRSWRGGEGEFNDWRRKRGYGKSVNYLTPVSNSSSLRRCKRRVIKAERCLWTRERWTAESAKARTSSGEKKRGWEGGELRVNRGSDFKLAIRLESFWNTGLDRQRRYSSWPRIIYYIGNSHGSHALRPSSSPSESRARRPDLFQFIRSTEQSLSI